MNVRFFNPGVAYQRIKPEIDAEIQRVLTAGDLILRKDVDQFEENLARFLGTKYAVSVASGTDALILSLKALNITGEVIVPSYTFRATIEAVHHAGATPVLADMGENWRKYRTENTQAIIPAHIAGEILDWEPDERILMIEDSAQAIGAAPLKGTTACYSFYPAKILGCYGDGGAIATNDEELARKLKFMRNHWKDDWRDFGYNSRLDNLQAAVLNVKLKYLPEDIERRKQIAQYYDAYLQNVVRLPTKREVYQDYIIECESEYKRDGLYDYLKSHGIETMKNGYPFPIATSKRPKALDYENRSLRIPCNPELTNREVEYVAEKIYEHH